MAAKFSTRKWFASKAATGSVSVKVPSTDGGDQLKFKLAGLPSAPTAEGLAELAKKQTVDKVTVKGDTYVTDGGIVHTEQVKAAPLEVAELLTDTEKFFTDEAKERAKKEGK